MRLPWVSRERFDLLQHNYDQLHLIANSRADDRYDALLDKYHALKLQGAVSVPESRTVEAKEPDAVQYAITEKANGRHGLKLYLTGWAAKQRQEKIEDTEIIERIQNWQSANDDE